MDRYLESSIRVRVSADAAYEQWVKVEDFPQFMSGVHEVRRINDHCVHWVVDVGGRSKEWDAEIVAHVPGRRIAWCSKSGAPNAGVVEFRQVGDAETEICIRMEYEPEGAVEAVGSLMKVADLRIKENLLLFKRFMESRADAMNP